MPFLTRFCAFARRFAPFWVVWLLVLLIPVSREIFLLYCVGSPLVPSAQPPWARSSNAPFSAFKYVRQHPHDLNGQLWRFSLLRQGIGESSESQDDEFPQVVAPPTVTIGNEQQDFSDSPLLRQAISIQQAFPREKWLTVLPVLAIINSPQTYPGVPGQSPTSKSGPPSLAARQRARRLVMLRAAYQRRLLAYIQSGVRQEPSNAFYSLCEATFWRRNHDWPRMWSALNRAARCQVFDSHDGDIARAIVAAHESIRPLSLEEKERVWRDNSRQLDSQLQQWPEFLRQEIFGTRRHKNKNHRRVVEIGFILAQIGDLMQRGKNTIQTASYDGETWKTTAWSLAPITNRRQRWGPYQSRDFAHYAARYGRKDIAALVPRWSARQSKIRQMSDYDPYGNRHSQTRSALWWAGWWRDVGAMVGVHIFYISLFWFITNIFLWRGVGAPSTRRERTVLPVGVGLFSLALGWWTWGIYQRNYRVPWTPTGMYWEIAIGSIGCFAFAAAPFLLAISCAFLTMRRYRSQFAAPLRIQTELRLTPLQALLLQKGAAFFYIVALILSFVFWFVFLWMAWNGTTGFDVGAWWPGQVTAKSWDLTVPSEALGVPIFYCLLLDAIGLIWWFAKWRYFSGRDNRPLTHAGLRFWKESLGIYLVLASLVYLSTSLCAWPARSAAHRELQLAMTRGELPP